jgi:hypothetical protein
MQCRTNKTSYYQQLALARDPQLRFQQRPSKEEPDAEYSFKATTPPESIS